MVVYSAGGVCQTCPEECQCNETGCYQCQKRKVELVNGKYKCTECQNGVMVNEECLEATCPDGCVCDGGCTCEASARRDSSCLCIDPFVEVDGLCTCTKPYTWNGFSCLCS